MLLAGRRNLASQRAPAWRAQRSAAQAQRQPATARVDGRLLAVAGYRIERLLAQGRTAAIYLAQDGLGCAAALKVLRGSRHRHPAAASRFATECVLLSSIRHEHVVHLLEHRVAGELAYLAMEYIPGGTLRRRLADRLQPGEAVALLHRAASGVAAAHRHGIVHRDVKPDNFLVRSDGALVLCDFGIAAAAGDGAARCTAGALLGTPCYAAPEQVQGAAPHPRADVYSLGVLFHELLCGRPPFAGRSALEVLCQHLAAPVPRLPAGLAAWQPLIDRMLDKRPHCRPADADALLLEIQRIAPGAGERAGTD